MSMIVRMKQFIVLSLFLVGMTSYSAFVQAQPLGIGQVVWVKGTVRAIDTQNQSRVLKRRDVIFERESLTTDSTSSGQLVFTDGGLLSLRPGSSIRIDQYHFSKTAPSRDKYIVSIAKGGFRTITGAISKDNPAAYQVNTPVATIGVRGTEWETSYKACAMAGAQCGLAVRIIKGRIYIRNKAGIIALTEGTDQRYALITSWLQFPQVTPTLPPALQTTVPIEPVQLQPAVPGQAPSTTLCI